MPAGWAKTNFDDAKWQAAKVLGPYGKTGPWTGQVWDGGGDDRFTVPERFPRRAGRARTRIRATPFSLVNMCFDAKGRLLVSRESGPILLCTQPDKDGVLQTVTAVLRAGP